jgi:LPS O-antigen subunit length determinant protein (WzzB/FepE family)
MDEGNKISGERIDNGVSAVEILQFLRTQFWWIAGFLILGGVVGVAMTFLHPRQWESTSVLQIGQIDYGFSNQPPTPIDSPSLAVQRLKVDPFVDQILRALSLPVEEGGNAEASLIRQTLDAEIVPNTNLIKLKVREYSPEAAKATLKLAQDDLIAIHTGLFQEGVAKLRSRLSGIDADIATAASKRDKLEATTSLKMPGGEAGVPAVNLLLGNMLDVSDRQLLESLKKSQSDTIQQLSPERTFNTKPLADISVSRRPVAPRRSYYAVLGALVGLLAGLFVAGSRHAKRR